MSPLPFNLYILWGQVPEDNEPAHYAFATEAEQAAFLTGVEACIESGTFDMQVLPHGRFRVNQAGDVRESSPPKQPVSPCDRFILWGEHPEPGERPQKFTLPTPEAAQAFQRGVEEASGWMGWQRVPGPTYRMLADLDDLADVQRSSWLVPAGRAALLKEAEADELAFPLFATPEGQFVLEGWEIPDEEPVPPAALTSSPSRRASRLR